MKKIVLLCVVAMSVTACNDSTTSATTDSRSADAPRIGSSNLPLATPTPASPATALSAESTPRVAAKPASAKEWAQIQSAASAIWSLADRQGQAHDRLMASLRKSAENLDEREMAKALLRYQFTLQDLQKAVDTLELPEVSNEETQGYLVDARTYLGEEIRLEAQKNQSLIHGMGGGEQLSDEDMASQNMAVNEQSVKCLHALNRLYWAYGYDSSDIDEKFRIKKTAKPSATVAFNRE